MCGLHLSSVPSSSAFEGTQMYERLTCLPDRCNPSGMSPSRCARRCAPRSVGECRCPRCRAHYCVSPSREGLPLRNRAPLRNHRLAPWRPNTEVGTTSVRRRFATGFALAPRAATEHRHRAGAERVPLSEARCSVDIPLGVFVARSARSTGTPLNSVSALIRKLSLRCGCRSGLIMIWRGILVSLILLTLHL